MGGVMAAKAALSEDLGAAPGEVSVAFLGAYPDPRDLPALAAAVAAGNLTVGFVSGSNDHIVNATALADAQAVLLGDGEAVLAREIPGGNHAGFGNYRRDFELRPDGEAAIPPEEQQFFTLKALSDFGFLPGQPGMQGADFTGRK